MSIRTRQIIKLILRMLVTVLLLIWAFSQVDLGQFWRTVQTARWQYLLGVWGTTAAFFWVQSVVLQLILKKQDCRVGVNTLFGASSVTALYSLFLPGFLSSGVKWYILKRHTGRGSNVLSSMLYNQVALMVVMMVIGLAGLVVTDPAQVVLPHSQQSRFLPLTCGIILVVLVLVSVLAVNERTGGTVVRLLAAALRPLPQTAREKGRIILAQIETFQTAGWRFHTTIALINAIDGFLVGFLMYLSAALAAHVTVPPGVLIWLCAIVYVLGRLPISIANLGVREATLVTLLAGYGVEESAALLMSMILFSSLIFMAAIGVSYQLYWVIRSKNSGPSQEPSLS
jgi:hypothetical protein